MTFGLSNSVIPGDLARTLTHSLLNQAHPIPLLPHQIPLPASEVKSRKENRQLNTATADASPPSPCLAAAGDLAETRKFSQAPFGIIGSGLSGASSTRASSSPPSSGPAFSAAASRNNSGGEFGANITNMVDPPQSLSAGKNSRCPSSEKAVKRSRYFTPASAKAIDDEDEPRRPSPRVRLSPTANMTADER